MLFDSGSPSSTPIIFRTREIAMHAETHRDQGQSASRILYSADRRVSVTIHAGLPAQVDVVHDGLTEAEVEAVLMDMAAEIPSPCMLITLPKVCWDIC